MRRPRLRRAEPEGASALQDEIAELRRRRSRALQEAEELRETLRDRMRELKRLGAELQAAELPGAESSGEELWKPPTEAPEVPAGWRTGPPDFVGVGCQRAGTTWWFRMFTSHPRVHPPLPPGGKELHYLGAFFSGRMRPEQVEGYYARFPRPPGELAGEWTPGYIAAHWIPRLLAEIAPEARVLVMLRDPLERYQSAISYSSRYGTARGRPDVQAMRSMYFVQLRRLLRHVPRERVLVLQYERCRAQPEEELRRTWAFLGVDADEAQMPEFGDQVGHRISQAALDPGVEEDLLAFWAEDIAALGREFPELDLALWPSVEKVGIPLPSPADGDRRR
jgi:hypothetical protein